MSKEVDAHWDDPNVESMYDKNLLWLECKTIDRILPDKGRILDAGCGEGEGTQHYASKHPMAKVVGLDRSPTRLDKAKAQLGAYYKEGKVDLVEASVLSMPFEDSTFNAVISQRCLINLLTDEERRAAVKEMVRVCKVGCPIVALEGSVEGHNGLNLARSRFGLPPIDVKFHNRFFTSDEMLTLFSSAGAEYEYSKGFGGYLYLTRVVKPAVLAEEGVNKASWNTDFNTVSVIEDQYFQRRDCDRLKMWIFTKIY